MKKYYYIIMKKLLITTIVWIICFIGTTSAYMEDKVFCTINKNNITVTLERWKNYKCSEYLNILSQNINTQYNDILSIQKIINQWYDTEFWKGIREEKRDKLKKMINIKDQISSAVSEFDRNLFLKLKEFLIYSATEDQAKFKKAYKHIQVYEKQWGSESYSVKKKIWYLQEAINVIDWIWSSTNYDTLVKNYNRYIYLKEQLKWK